MKDGFMKKTVLSFAPILCPVVFAREVYAITASSLDVKEKVGNVGNIAQGFIFAFNLLRYLGWAGVIVGVGYAIFGFIYKAYATDNEDVMKTAWSHFVKSLMITLTGLILIGAGFIVKVVAGLFGVDTAVFEVPSVLSG